MIVVAALAFAVAAVVSATGMSAVISAYAMARHRDEVPWRPMLTVSLAALTGMPIGLLVLTGFSEKSLTLLIGLVLLVLIAVLARGLRLPRRRPVEAGVGFVSGGLLTSTGVNGPPIVAAFQAMGMPPSAFRATLLASLCVQDVVAVGGFAVIGQFSPVVLTVVGAGLPGLALGWLVGDRIFAQFRPGQLRWAVLAMLGVNAAMTLGQALRS